MFTLRRNSRKCRYCNICVPNRCKHGVSIDFVGKGDISHGVLILGWIIIVGESNGIAACGYAVKFYRAVSFLRQRQRVRSARVNDVHGRVGQIIVVTGKDGLHGVDANTVNGDCAIIADGVAAGGGASVMGDAVGHRKVVGVGERILYRGGKPAIHRGVSLGVGETGILLPIGSKHAVARGHLESPGVGVRIGTVRQSVRQVEGRFH